LFDCLDALEVKYGLLPSILATRGDFTEDPSEKNRLLLRAYGLADNRDDAHNALYIAHSLAHLWIETLNDAAEGRRWLECMSRYLLRVDDGSFTKEYRRLRDLLVESEGG